jgi:hypothetical protein
MTSEPTYKLVRGTVDEIEDRVNAEILDGWEPQGGVCYWGHSQFGYSLFAQAMVRKCRISPATEFPWHKVGKRARKARDSIAGRSGVGVNMTCEQLVNIGAIGFLEERHVGWATIEPIVRILQELGFPQWAMELGIVN